MSADRKDYDKTPIETKNSNKPLSRTNSKYLSTTSQIDKDSPSQNPLNSEMKTQIQNQAFGSEKDKAHRLAAQIEQHFLTAYGEIGVYTKALLLASQNNFTQSDKKEGVEQLDVVEQLIAKHFDVDNDNADINALKRSLITVMASIIDTNLKKEKKNSVKLDETEIKNVVEEALRISLNYEKGELNKLQIVIDNFEKESKDYYSPEAWDKKVKESEKSHQTIQTIKNRIKNMEGFSDIILNKGHSRQDRLLALNNFLKEIDPTLAKYLIRLKDTAIVAQFATDVNSLLPDYVASRLTFGPSYLFIDPTSTFYKILSANRKEILEAAVLETTAKIKSNAEYKDLTPHQLAVHIYKAIPALQMKQSDEEDVVIRALDRYVKDPSSSAGFTHPFVNKVDVGRLAMLIPPPDKKYVPKKVAEETKPSFNRRLSKDIPSLSRMATFRKQKTLPKLNVSKPDSRRSTIKMAFGESSNSTPPALGRSPSTNMLNDRQIYRSTFITAASGKTDFFDDEPHTVNIITAAKKDGADWREWYLEIHKNVDPDNIDPAEIKKAGDLRESHYAKKTFTKPSTSDQIDEAIKAKMAAELNVSETTLTAEQMKIAKLKYTNAATQEFIEKTAPERSKSLHSLTDSKRATLRPSAVEHKKITPLTKELKEERLVHNNEELATSNSANKVETKNTQLSTQAETKLDSKDTQSATHASSPVDNARVRQRRGIIVPPQTPAQVGSGVDNTPTNPGSPTLFARRRRVREERAPNISMVPEDSTVLSKEKVNEILKSTQSATIEEEQELPGMISETPKKNGP